MPGLKRINEDKGDADDGRDDEQRSRPLEDAEGGAGVAEVHDADVPVGVGPGVPAVETGTDDPLGHEVAGDDGGSQGEEAGIGRGQAGREAGHGFMIGGACAPLP